MDIAKRIFNVKASYIVIFISLVVWAFFAYFTMNEIISSQKVYGKLINISGKQRMLSQKTTLISKRVLETKDENLLQHLKELVKKMKEDHHFLITNLTSNHIMDIYFKKSYSIDFKVQTYFNLLDEFLVTLNQQSIVKLEQYSFELLPLLDHAVNEFEKESDANTLELKNREFFILIGTLFTLILEAIFIMIPALKIAKESEQRLLHFNEELISEVEKKRKQIEKEHKHKKFYFNTINTLVIALDTSANVSMINKRGLKILGFEEKDILGKNLCEVGIIPTEDINRVKKLFNQIINSEIDIQETHFESRLLDRDGNEKTFTWSNAVIKEDDKIVGLLSSGIDISNEKKQENIIKEQTKLASMGEMIGNIAHQWRQPLSVISTAATGMKVQSELDILEKEHVEDMCDKINESAQYLSQTIDDFRNFIKGDSKPVQFNLHTDTDSFIKLVDTTIKKYNINVILDLEEGINIKGFPNELIQCFINIFNNAKDALLENHIDESERFIFISQHIYENKVQIVFKDNAGGIPENLLEKIFEPYFTTKDDAHGTGLGLHMTKSLIVSGMGGDITVSNESFSFNGKEYYGAKFIIELPLNS